jgi:hypothetical protein
MTKQGVKTSETMSALKQVLANIASPTKEAEEAADKLSIKFGADAVKAAGGLANFLNMLSRETRDNVEAQVALFGSVESFNAISLLASKTGLHDLNVSLTEIEGSAGDTRKAFDDVSDTVGFKLRQLKSGISRAAIEIGFGLTEGLGFDKLNDIPQRVEDASRTIRASARSFADAFSEAFAPMWDAVGADWEGLAATLGGAAGNIVNAFISVANIITNLVNSAAFQALVSVLNAAGATLNFIIGGPGATAKGGEIGKIVGGVTGVGTGKVLDVRGGIGMVGGQWNPFLAEMQIRQQAALAVQQRITRERQEIGIAGHLGAAIDPFAEATAGRSQAQIREEYATELARVRREAGASRRSHLSGQVAEIDRANASLKAGIQAADRLSKQQQDRMAIEQKRAAEEKAPTATLLKSAAMWSVNIIQENSVNLKDKKAKGRGSFSARGRGNATLRSSAEQNYMLMEGRLIPMGDEFHYGHMISEEPTATLPAAG